MNTNTNNQPPIVKRLTHMYNLAIDVHKLDINAPMDRILINIQLANLAALAKITLQEFSGENSESCL